VRLNSLYTSATIWPIVTAANDDDDDDDDDDDESGAVGGIRCKGSRSTPRKPAPVPLCPPQIPHGLTWARTRSAAVGNRGLAA
jgi:hypothetical protein